MNQLKSIEVVGLRGVRYDLPLTLDGGSILVYGDNGSGKSSITDALEWFYYGAVAHLSSQEIGRGGLEALRNVMLPDDKAGLVRLGYSEATLDSEKRILSNLKCEMTNTSDLFKAYLAASSRENLILRYRDLLNFVTASKSDKLEYLSNVIGFGEVTKTRAILRTVLNELKRDAKNKDFDGEISKQQSRIIDQLGHNVTSDRQFVDSVNELVKGLNLGKTASTLADVGVILKLIEQPADARSLELRRFYGTMSDYGAGMNAKLQAIMKSYEAYRGQFVLIASDLNRLKSLLLERLLTEGLRILKSPAVSEDRCPLCLQPKSRAELLRELESRSSELARIKEERSKLAGLKDSLQSEIAGPYQASKSLLANKDLSLPENQALMRNTVRIKEHLEKYLTELRIEALGEKVPEEAASLHLDNKVADDILEFCSREITRIDKAKADDKRFEAYRRALEARTAYLRIKDLQKQKQVIEIQCRSLETIYSSFVNKQKEGLEAFISLFSDSIRDLYGFMNPNENISDFKIVPLQKEDELVGITIEFKFFESQISPPTKYLSESHLNCLGIAFFLASVSAFNKQNRFLVLDDVISSFDSTHRKRFADLLNERFSSYQMIVLTHERTWFEYLANLVKGKGWRIATVKWSDSKGTYIDEPPEDLRQRIQRRISSGEVEGLGNDIRKYLENRLKDVDANLEVKVKFLFNDTNEERMCHELLSDLRGSVNRHGSDDLKDNPIFERLLGSLFIANKDSHDSSVELKIDDFKAFWSDVLEFESLFYCDSVLCGDRCISLRRYDAVAKQVMCRCGKKSQGWKK